MIFCFSLIFTLFIGETFLIISFCVLVRIQLLTTHTCIYVFKIFLSRSSLWQSMLLKVVLSSTAETAWKDIFRNMNIISLCLKTCLAGFFFWSCNGRWLVMFLVGSGASWQHARLKYFLLMFPDLLLIFYLVSMLGHCVIFFSTCYLIFCR